MSLEYACLFRVINEVNRRRILVVLYMRELSVQELQSILSLGQSTISAHLAQLKLSNLVGFRRKGKFVLYRFLKGSNAPLNVFVESLVGLVKEESWYERDQRKLKDLLKKKKEVSLSFYEGLDVQNKRHPGQTDFSIFVALLRSVRNKRIVDIGCGNGNLVKEFGAFNNSVIGVDIEEKQIELAKEIHCDSKSKNISFIVANGENTKQKNGCVDFVIFSQSLHHILSPEKAIAEAYRILDENGMLIILDLNKHSEVWVKDIYGDIHMGFTHKTIGKWVKSQGFFEISIDIHAGDEKFPQFETLILTAQKK